MTKTHPIRVRFAPSPTGALHIGGARTALFNFLFARHHQGQFLLRIEDTDKARSKPELTDQILRSLKWLGMSWDEDIVFQSDRRKKHQDVCFELLKRGAAYRCFCSPDALAEKRHVAEKETGGYRYDRHCLFLSDKDVQERISRNDPHVLRIRVPEGETRIHDRVFGDIVVNNAEIDDFILLRSDGSPVYQVAVVSDDHEMAVTHVIRGDDHLSNTPKQILIYKAMDWETPVFAHVPLIWGPDKKRLSKRHGATAVEEYQNFGYLPETLCSFLALLGWNPGDDTELMLMDTLIHKFSLDQVSKKPAVFDEQKLIWMNGQFIKNKSLPDLAEVVRPLLVSAGLLPDGPESGSDSEDRLPAALALFQDRMKQITDFSESGRYFFVDPNDYEEQAVIKHWLKEGVPDRLKNILQQLKALDTWNESTLEDCIRTTAEAWGVGAGKLIHPIRLALTGMATSPGLFEMMNVLGRETVCRRLQAAVAYLSDEKSVEY